MSSRPDIAWSKLLARGSINQIFLWASAAALALAAHAGAAWWLLQEPPEPAVDLGAPVAIMIDLAPVPMAPAALEEEVAPDAVDSMAAEDVPVTEEAEPVETAELIEPDTAEAVTEPEPVEPVETEVAEVEEPVEPEPVEEVEPDLELPEVTEIPLPRPKLSAPKPKVVEKPREPEKPKQAQLQPKQKAPAPSRDARAAKVVAQQEAPRAAAPLSSRGASSVSPAKWQSRMLAHLERRKRYPAAAKRKRLEGTAQVRFTIDESGNVLSVSLAGSSGVPELDEEVISMVRRASPVPPPPPGVNRTIVVPVRFNIR